MCANRIYIQPYKSTRSNQLDQQQSTLYKMQDGQDVERDFTLEIWTTHWTVLKIVRDLTQNNLKPIWWEISNFSSVIKYFWNRIQPFEIREVIICLVNLFYSSVAGESFHRGNECLSCTIKKTGTLMTFYHVNKSLKNFISCCIPQKLRFLEFLYVVIKGFEFVPKKR